MWTGLVTGAQEFNRPTMLQLIVSIINPTARLGVSTYKMEIQTATLQKFRNNVQEMVDFMEANYEEIVTHNCMYPDYRMHLFSEVLTSKNDIFPSMIQQLKDTWKIGENDMPYVLIEAAFTKYNNMVKKNIWDQKYPKDDN